MVAGFDVANAAGTDIIKIYVNRVLGSDGNLVVMGPLDLFNNFVADQVTNTIAIGLTTMALATPLFVILGIFRRLNI